MSSIATVWRHDCFAFGLCRIPILFLRPFNEVLWASITNLTSSFRKTKINAGLRRYIHYFSLHKCIAKDILHIAFFPMYGVHLEIPYLAFLHLLAQTIH